MRLPTVDELIFALWRRRRASLSTFTIVLLIALGAAMLLQPRYSSQSLLLVGEPSQQTDVFALGQANEVMIRTYAEVLASGSVRAAVDGRLQNGEGQASKNGTVQVKPVPDSQLIAVVATADTPEGAQSLANSYSALAADEVRSRLRSEQGGFDIQQVVPASLNAQPVRPQRVVLIAGGAILGAALAVGVALLGERLDAGALTDESEDLGGIPLLARLDDWRPGSQGDRGSIAIQQIERALGRVLLAEPKPSALAVVPILGVDDGARLARRLGEAAAGLGFDALVVDADPYVPPGAPEAADEDVQILSRPRIRSSLKGSDSERVGAAPARPTLASIVSESSIHNVQEYRRSITSMLERAGAKFDLVLFAGPSLDRSALALVLMRAVRTVILVADESSPPRDVETSAIRLRLAGVAVAGVVVQRDATSRRRSLGRVVRALSRNSTLRGRGAHGR